MVTVLVVSFVVLLLLGVPVSFAMALSAFLALVTINADALQFGITGMFHGMDQFPLLAIPFFVLAGDLMDQGGISARLVNLAKALVGHIRGGLGHAVVIGEIFFSGISGSTVADVSAVGSLLIPAMHRAGYSKPEAVAIVSAASAMGILVPPCIMMIVLAFLTNQSVGALFVAGFIPAFVLAAFLIALIYVQARRRNLPAEPRVTRAELRAAITDGLIALMMPLIIFGGILGGVFTATEAAVVATVYALVVGMFVYRQISIAKLPSILLNASVSTAMVMMLVGGATIFSWVLTTQQVPRQLAQTMLQVSGSPAVFLFVSVVVMVVLGAVLEGLPALIILAPVLFPVSAQFGVNPLHFGIVMIAAMGIGMFIPPIGVGMFIACSIARIRIEQAARPFMPYLAMLLLGLLVITYVPWFTLVLPDLLLGGRR